jgi:hypothetical protein
MKKDINSQRYAEILARYLSGEMSEAESHAFEEEFFVSEENKIRIEKMKKQWKAMEGYMDKKTPNTGIAWDKLHDRLRDGNLIPVQTAGAKYCSWLA